MSIKYIKSYILIGQSWQKTKKKQKNPNPSHLHPMELQTFIKSAESINSPTEPCYFSTSVL